jgi:hypothetical protein
LATPRCFGSSFMRRIAARSVLCIAGSLAIATGCKSVQRFDTGSSDAYCLELIEDGITNSEMLPDDAGVLSDAGVNNLRLAVTIDSQHLSTRPGYLWSNDAAFGLCSPKRLFDKVPIRTIQPALNDVVSSVQLTPDHIQDIFTVVDSTCQGTMVSILSLIDGGSVEVRLFKPKPEKGENGTASDKTGFGLFARSQRRENCEF